ncbi:MAG TPA: carboxypeptidase regulatory-like domain-containing protein, partial [Ferruginibacter sp.]|nr:carboxypeptidase regulatory-like domain-containing protein [Ferruginibacter sp.]
MYLKKILPVLIALFAIPGLVSAQVTTSGLSGTVKNSKNEALVGATIVATHTPTGTVFRTQSRANGRYDIPNMNNGGPYTIEITYVGHDRDVRNDVYLALGEVARIDIFLKVTAQALKEVTVSATARNDAGGKGGTSAALNRAQLENTTAVGRNIYDYIKKIPYARTIGGNEGAVTIAGQNNRYNSFYIDGAINNDVFGLANSGTNGGQTGGSPISIDAIDQIQVLISPYDASIGNFTGGSINAVTKSGTNMTMGSVYYIFRNEKLAGRNPLQKSDTAQRFPAFTNKTYGATLGGPVIKNKLFYFFSYEQQRDRTPQQYDFATYRGNTNTTAGIQSLIDYVKGLGYDMGDWLNTTKKFDADRFVGKLDWNISTKHRFSLSYRYSKLVSTTPSLSSATTINFSNGGVYFPSVTKSFSGEIKSAFTRSLNNNLLVTYSDVLDDRGFVGSPFPRVSLNDGSGTINFGAENSSTQNLLTQKNIQILDKLKLNVRNHSFTFGVDYERFKDLNVFIQNTYGNYFYNTTTAGSGVARFLANTTSPTSYNLGFPNTDKLLDDKTAAAANFTVSKIAFFFNDEIKIGSNLTLNIGIRADKWKFITVPYTDQFTNDSALALFSRYYDLKGARSGQKPTFPVSWAPRFGFTYKIPEAAITVRGGVGVFTGRMPLVWPGGTYNNNGYYVGGYTASATALNTIRFRWDPTDPAGSVWTPSQVGQGFTKGPLNLIAKNFKMPKLLRTSIAVDKNFGNGWTGTGEILVSRNINEIYYYNINILPPIGMSVGPGSRQVYGVSGSSTATIPITNNGTGTNPYDNAILVTNNEGQKGFAYNFNIG